MSKKCRDIKGRWRSLTVSFRVSPEENTMIHDMAMMSGMTKQDYCIARLLNKEVTISRNPRVYAGMKSMLERICGELERINSTSDVSEDLLETLNMIAGIIWMMGERHE